MKDWEKEKKNVTFFLGDENESKQSLNNFDQSIEFYEFQKNCKGLVACKSTDIQTKTGRCNCHEIFKDRLCNPVTPLNHYIVDTWHFKMVMATICLKNLILPLVQHIEDQCLGVGVHAYCASCKCSGYKHLGSHMHYYASVKCKTAVVNRDVWDQNNSQCSLPQACTPRKQQFMSLDRTGSPSG